MTRRCCSGCWYCRARQRTSLRAGLRWIRCTDLPQEYCNALVLKLQVVELTCVRDSYPPDTVAALARIKCERRADRCVTVCGADVVGLAQVATA